MTWVTSDDIDQYRRDVAKFFERLAVISEDNAPPGANAASGWFVSRVNEDKEIHSVSPPRGNADDPEAEQIFSILRDFEQEVLKVFSENKNHKSNWHKSSSAALQVFEKLKDELKDTAEKIVKVAGLDTTAVADFAVSIKALVDKIHNAGIVYEGEHANGYIQPGVKAAATKAVGAMASIKAAPTDPFAGKFVTALTAVLEEIVTIPDYKNEPWLYADWQLRFQTIARAGSKALYGLRA